MIRNKICTLMIGAALFVSCQKNNSSSGSAPPVIDASESVYAAGDTGLYFKTVATYWNGKAVSTVGNKYVGVATAIGVAGSDVYLAVDTVTPLGDSQVATLWKNGVPSVLGTGSIYSMLISGKDVYLAGNLLNASGTANIPTYWKNGVATSLSSGRAYFIAISGTDVYVSGVLNNKAVYWKNNVLVNLPNSTLAAGVSSIAVSGSDVYIAGTTLNSFGLAVPTYWKNGVPVYLLNNGVFTFVNCIAVSGTDIYLVGYAGTIQNPIATYWKNGVAVALGDGNAVSIVLSGQDIYIGGNANGHAVYWKNGAVTDLGQGYLSSIALGK